MENNSPLIRVTRLVTYVGTLDAVRHQLANSIHGTKTFNGSYGDMHITAVTLEDFPVPAEDWQRGFEEGMKMAANGHDK